MALLHMHSTNVIEAAIVRLPDQNVHGTNLLVAFLAQQVIGHSFRRAPHGQCVGKHDRRFQNAELFDLSTADHLAKAVADVYRRR